MGGELEGRVKVFRTRDIIRGRGMLPRVILEGRISIGYRGGKMLISMLTFAFVVLKLVGVISWSWLWVLSPLWVALLLIVGIIVFGLRMRAK